MEKANYATCRRCGRALSGDDIPANRKMISKASTSFFCLDCLAWYCGTTRQKIEQMIAYLRESGNCSLFPKIPE